MNICVVTPYFAPHPGGSQRYIEELFAQIVANDPNTHVDIVCYNTDHAPKEELVNQLHIHRVSCWEILPGQFALPNYWELIHVVRQLKATHGPYDIVNSHTRFFDNSWWAPLLAKYFGAKSILIDHCATVPVHSHGLIRRITQWVDHLLVPWITKPYDKVIAVSQATRNYLQSLGVTVHGVLYPATADISLAPVKDPSRVVVTFASRLIPAKGVRTFISAVQPLLMKYPFLEISIAGDGPLFTEIKAHANERLHVLGRLNKTEMQELLAKTDILVHPSIHHEGFPVLLLEAGMAECAVITTNQGGVSELVTHNDTGYIVPPVADAVRTALETLIQDTSQRHRLAKNLSTKVRQQFTLNQQVKNWYQSIT